MLYPQLTPTRCVVSLNGMWELAREHEPGNQHEGFKAEKHVAVPASYNDLYAEEGFRMWKDGMWYQRAFAVPKTLQGERLVLRFGAVAYRARVFVNGREVGSHEGGHLPFECEVTDVVRWDNPNLLCVRCENRLSATTVPMGELRNAGENGQFAGQYPDVPFDFFPYAGIQRDVCLYTTPKAAWLESVRVTTAVRADGVATVTVAGRVVASAKVICTLPSGACRARRTKLSLKGRFFSISDNFTVDIQIPDAELWDVFQPNLYDAEITLLRWRRRRGHLQTALRHPHDTRDRESAPPERQARLPPGLRAPRGLPDHRKGFVSRGERPRPRVTEMGQRQQLSRTTHYPYSEELVRLADEQGILLIAEAPAVSVNFDHLQDESVRQELYDRHATALTELIDRDFNAPSVIAWSVANEATTNRPAARDYFATLAGRATVGRHAARDHGHLQGGRRFGDGRLRHGGRELLPRLVPRARAGAGRALRQRQGVDAARAGDAPPKIQQAHTRRRVRRRLPRRLAFIASRAVERGVPGGFNNDADRRDPGVRLCDWGARLELRGLPDGPELSASRRE